MNKRKSEGEKSNKNLIETMKKFGAKHKGKCPHCGKLYEFDEVERMFNRSWDCKGCPPKYADEHGLTRFARVIRVSDLVDVELFKLPNEWFE